VPHGGVGMSDFDQVFPQRLITVEQKALGKPMWQGYFPLIEHNAVSFVKALYEKGGNGKKTMEMYPWLRQVWPLTFCKIIQGLLTSAEDDA
jgi:hypothetical protein